MRGFQRLCQKFFAIIFGKRGVGNSIMNWRANGEKG